jgi:hypothetical protein
LDVSGDTLVNGLDVLMIVNWLNDPTKGAGPLPLPATPPPYYDVNGDNFISAIDALVIVNYLNSLPQSLSAQAVMAGASASPAAAAMAADDEGAGDLSFGFTIASKPRAATDQVLAAAADVAVDAGPAAVEAAVASELLCADVASAADAGSHDEMWADEDELDDILVAIGGDVCDASGGKNRAAWDSV